MTTIMKKMRATKKKKAKKTRKFSREREYFGLTTCW
jgi:hypothetical protein